MHSVVAIYRRYFSRHRLGLLLVTLCFIGIASNGVIRAAMQRYLIDEVLEVNLSDKPLLKPNGQTRIVRIDPLPKALHQRETLEELTRQANVADGYRPAVLHQQLPVEGSLSDRIASQEGKTRSQKVKWLLLLGLAMISTHLLAFAGRGLSQVKLGLITRQVVFRIRRHIHEKLLRLQMSYHDQNHIGRLLSRAVDDVQVIEDNFAMVLTELASFIGLIVINVSIMFFIHPKLALLTLLAMPFYAVCYHLMRNKIRQLWRQQRKERAALYGLVRDRLAHPQVVKSFVKEKREHIRFYQRIRSLFRRQRRIVVLNNFLAMMCTCISAAMSAGVLGYGIVLLRRGELTLGYLLFFYGTAYGLLWPIAALSQITAVVQQLRISCERVLQVLDEPVTIYDRVGSHSLTALRQGIEFRNVTFAYGGSDQPAVQNITLSIPAGSQVCLMGKSGAGKSTVAALLLRLYEPQEGQILVDGVDLRDIKLASIRKQVAYVPQEPILFSGHLADNILYGNNGAGREAMQHAAQAAEIHDFIASLPEGYDTVIGENGLRLSGGQKQRLSLARALVTDPAVLVLDDCTSALDAQTEARIQQTLKTALKDKTVLIISHRMSVASNADFIVVMDGGRIVEVGRHEELLAKEGYYWQLIRDQLQQQVGATVSVTELRRQAAAA